MPTPDSKQRLIAFVVAMAVLIAAPLAVIATDAFTDVPNENVHHADITWLADAGVTLGCNPPTNDRFCPTDAVTRQQMASFLRRLAENRVVDAATALQADHATTADDAETVGGIGPSDLNTFVVGNSVELDSAGGLLGATPKSLLEVSFDAPVSAAMALTVTSGRIVYLSGAAAEVTLWVQHNNGTCAFNSRMPGGYTRLTVAAEGTEPFLGSASFTLGSGLQSGSHTLTICGSSIGTASAVVVGATAVVSPSAYNVVSLSPLGTDSGPSTDR